jgi:hypothetical protein
MTKMNLLPQKHHHGAQFSAVSPRFHIRLDPRSSVTTEQKRVSANELRILAALEWNGQSMHEFKIHVLCVGGEKVMHIVLCGEPIDREIPDEAVNALVQSAALVAVAHSLTNECGGWIVKYDGLAPHSPKVPPHITLPPYSSISVSCLGSDRAVCVTTFADGVLHWQRGDSNIEAVRHVKVSASLPNLQVHLIRELTETLCAGQGPMIGADIHQSVVDNKLTVMTLLMPTTPKVLRAHVIQLTM